MTKNPNRDEDTEPDKYATSDTGDAEPIVDDTDADDSASDDPHNPSTAATGDAARAPTRAAEGLVLDEINEGGQGFLENPEDESLVFVNDGAERIDLSGWTVENDDGRSYQFPPDTALEPDDRLVLHSCDGEDTEGHRFWNAEESVWGDRGDTVTVRTSGGELVLEESYEA